MNAQDSAKFSTLIGNVYAFYRQDHSEFAINVWWQAMSPYDFSAVADALNRHCVNPDSGQFMPKPADVVKMLGGSTQDSALSAWSKVDRAVRQVGTYETVAFDDPIIHRVLHDMGGWIHLGMKTEDEWPFLRNEFVNRYRGYRMRNETPEYPRTLIGMAEAQNNQNGQRSQPPIMVGDAEMARRVLSGGSTAPLIGFERISTHAAPALPNKAAA